MKRYQFLLLDANVIIELFSLGLWDALTERCDIHLSDIVVQEADYYEDASGAHRDIDLSSYIDGGRVRVFSHSASDLLQFKSSFDRAYLEKLDPGETESLLQLLSRKEEDLLLCSADAIVFRVLGNLKMSDKGLSLEEVLHRSGLRRKLKRQFTREFRLRWSRQGLAESLQGGGFKMPSD